MDPLDRILRLLGTNRVKLRWRWQRFKESMARGARSAENRSRSLAYEHQLCPRCGQPAAKDAERCVKCGSRLHGAGVHRASKVASMLLPEGVPIVTMVFLAACIALFFITVKTTHDMLGEDARGLTPSNAALMRFGGNHGYWTLLADGWWRVITANFLHGGIFHILMNGYAMWLTGGEIEQRFGRARTAVMLVVTGAAGHLFAAWWAITQTAPPYPVVIGASTAAFGQMGLLLGHALRLRGHMGREMRGRMVPWVLYGVLMSFAIPQISWQGHLGGLAAGFLLGLVMADKLHGRRVLPEKVWTVLALACVALVAWAFALAARFQLPEGIAS
jgi:membrane associated rhomboid family serine protease